MADLKNIEQPDANTDESANLQILTDLPGYKAARKAMSAIMDSKSTWSKQREKVDDAEKFYIGEQWSVEDKAYLKDQDRIPVVFNFLAKHIDMVVGAEIHNRQDTKFIPRNLDPESLPKISALGELETSAYNWVMDLCNGEDEVSFSFGDLLKGGMGFVETYLDRTIDGNPRIVVRRVDPLEMMWDARAKMQNLEDARWIARAKLVTMQEAINQFPDMEPELRAISKFGDALQFDNQPEQIEEYTPIMYEEGRRTVNPSPSGKKGMISIIQYQWWEIETVHVVKDPVTGKEKELTEKKFEKVKKAAKKMNQPLDSAESKRKVYKQIFIAGNMLPLTDAEALPVQAGGFTFKVITGKWDQEEKIWRGLLHQMMDPQRYANKYLSQMIHIINSNPKGGLIAEPDAFVDPAMAERDWSSPDKVVLVTKGAIKDQKFITQSITPLPNASHALWQECVQAITGVAGINVEMLGASQGDLPALTMRQRMVQGMQINAIYFNALTRMRRNLARLVLEYIREFIADDGQTMVRIGGAFNTQMLPLMKDKLSPEYDVVIDEAVKSPNAKAEVWMALQPILPVMVRSGMLVPEIVDLVPGMPASLAAKIKERMGDQAQVPNMGNKGKGGQAQGKPPEDPGIVQGKVQKLQEEVNLLKAKQNEVLARARALDAGSQIKAQVASHEVNAKQAKAATDRQMAQAKLIGESAKIEAHRQKAEAQSMKMAMGGMGGMNRGPRVMPSSES